MTSEVPVPPWAERFSRPIGGWLGVAMAALAGAAAAAAHPPYGFLPGLFGFAVVMAMLDAAHAERRLRSGFLRGWAAGFGYLAVSTAWIGEPFMVDAATHGWQAPFAMSLLPASVALIWGAAGMAYAALRPSGARRVVVFASLFAIAEWLRGHVLTGFPWDLPGEAWRAGSGVSQGAALVGVYGLSWITLAFAATPAVLLAPANFRTRAIALAAAVLTIGGLGLWGRARVAPPPWPDAPQVRLVQPNLPEPPAWSPKVVARAVEAYTDLTRRPAAKGPPALVIWPEGAVPESLNTYLAPGSPARDKIMASLTPGQTLLVGGYRVEPMEGARGRDASYRYFNTLLVVARTADGLQSQGAYDKHHLVPFGEYLPMRGLFDPLGVSKLVSVGEDFTAGPQPRPLRLGALIFQPLICYEALFPGLAAQGGGARAALLVNISDDAWFGRHAGPWQHFNLSSYRAIEEGIPMARVTPTGVSGVIDATGRPTGAVLGPGRSGVIDAPVPRALPPTPYVAWRDIPFWILVFSGLAAALKLGHLWERALGFVKPLSLIHRRRLYVDKKISTRCAGE